MSLVTLPRSLNISAGRLTYDRHVEPTHDVFVKPWCQGFIRPIYRTQLYANRDNILLFNRFSGLYGERRTSPDDCIFECASPLIRSAPLPLSNAPALKRPRKRCRAADDLFLWFLSRPRRCNPRPTCELPRGFDPPGDLV